MKRHIFVLAFSLSASAQTFTLISESNFSASVGNTPFVGVIEVQPNPKCKIMTNSGQSFALRKVTYCVGKSVQNCQATTSAGVISIVLLPTADGSGTSPAHCSFMAHFTPDTGAPFDDTWVVHIKSKM